MKVKATVSQPSPNEVIKDYLANNNNTPLFVTPDGLDFLTEDGKACLALGIKVFSAYVKTHKKN